MILWLLQGEFLNDMFGRASRLEISFRYTGMTTYFFRGGGEQI